jgi:curved DNA-binding protein CbpA
MTADQSAAHSDVELACSNAASDAIRPNSSRQTYYDLLGVAETADHKAIKTAYRSLAKALHPDVNALDPETAQHFASINKAYRVLRDPHRRRRYDTRLHGSPRGATSKWGFSWRTGRMAMISMFATAGVVGPLALWGITLWSADAPVRGHDEAMAVVMSAPADRSADALLSPIELWRLLITSRPTQEISQERGPAHSEDRARFHPIARRAETRGNVASRAVRASGVFAWIAKAARLATAPFSGFEKTNGVGTASNQAFASKS